MLLNKSVGNTHRMRCYVNKFLSAVKKTQAEACSQCGHSAVWHSGHTQLCPLCRMYYCQLCHYIWERHKSRGFTVRGSNTGRGYRYFPLLSKTSWPALGPTQPPTVLSGFKTGGAWSWPFPFGADVKNVWSFASTPRIRLLVAQDKLQPYSFNIQI